MGNEQLTYIDAAAVQSSGNDIYVSLINRSWNTHREVALTLPKGYRASEVWELQHTDINAFNSPENSDVLAPKTRAVSSKKSYYNAKLLPCAVVLVKLVQQ